MNSVSSEFGVPVEICLVTRSLQQSMESLQRFGIGPWRVYRFDATTVSDRRSFSEPDDYEIDVAFASKEPLVWEIMQPLKGAPALQSALDHGPFAWHHLAFDGGSLSFAQRRKRLDELEASPVLSGVWLDIVPFYFFTLPEMPSLIMEIYDFPADFVYPEPIRWFPTRQ